MVEIKRAGLPTISNQENIPVNYFFAVIFFLHDEVTNIILRYM